MTYGGMGELYKIARERSLRWRRETWRSRCEGSLELQRGTTSVTMSVSNTDGEGGKLGPAGFGAFAVSQCK